MISLRLAVRARYSVPMSVAPLIPSQEAASPAGGAGKANARPKRITPPAHWKETAPAATPKHAPAKAVLPTVMAAATAPSPALSRAGFAALLLVGVVALNALLLWLFPLPALQAPRRDNPVFSPAPIAEDSELPVWLRP